MHKCSLKHGQQLLVGHSRFRFDSQPGTQTDVPPAERVTADWRQLVANDGAATLVEMASRGDARTFTLAGENWIGRDPGCTVPVDDPMVGLRHARLWRHDKGWRLESHESRDGVWIRIDKPITVNRKCLFQLGEQRFQLRVV